MLKLLIEAPGGLVTLVALNGERTSIGRASCNDVILDDLRTSRFHAVIDIEASFSIIKDLSSRNGLYLNGQRIRVKALSSGDRLAIGGCQIQLIAEEDCHEIVIEGDRSILGLREDLACAGDDD